MSSTDTPISRRSVVAGGMALGLAHFLPRSAGARQATPAASPAAQFPRTITHKLGETIIPAQPERIVAVSDFVDLDYLLSLGVDPVLYGYTNAWNSGAMPWQTAAADLPSFDSAIDPDLEAIAAAKPDLIIAMESIAETYDVISAIAPTIVLGWDNEFHLGLPIVASALGLDARGDELLAEVDAQIAVSKETLAPIADKRIMVAFQYAETFYIWGSETAASKLFLQMGLNFIGGEEPTLNAVSLEQAHLLSDADIILSVASDPDALAVQEASPIFRSLPAVQNGGYEVLTVVQGRALGDGLSPLSLPWVMPQFIELMQRVAAGDGKKLG